MAFSESTRVLRGTMSVLFKSLYFCVNKAIGPLFHPGHDFLCWERVLRKESIFLDALIQGDRASEHVSRFHQKRLFTGEKKIEKHLCYNKKK